MDKKYSIIVLISSFLLMKMSYAEDRPLNEMPMYNEQHNPDVEQNKEFSEGAAKLGWQYYDKGDMDTAIKRFNQAWMFDRESVDAFWGFGLIMGQRAMQENPEYNLRESIKYLEMAKAKSQNNHRLLVDLAYSYTLLGSFLKDEGRPESKDNFIQARKLFEESEKLDSTYPLLYSNWSILEFYCDNYAEAKTRLDHAKQLGFKPNPAYEKELASKLKQ